MSENIELLHREEQAFNELFETATSNGGKKKTLPKGDVDALSNVFNLVKEKIQFVKNAESKIILTKLVLVGFFMSSLILINIFVTNYPLLYLSFYPLLLMAFIGSILLIFKQNNNKKTIKRHLASCHNLLALLSDQKLLYQFDMNTKLVMEEHILDLKHVLGIDK